MGVLTALVHLVLGFFQQLLKHLVSLVVQSFLLENFVSLVFSGFLIQVIGDHLYFFVYTVEQQLDDLGHIKIFGSFESLLDSAQLST